MTADLHQATVPMALGAGYFGTRVDQQTSMAMLDRFVSAGGTLIDTANNYALWSSDSGFGVNDTLDYVTENPDVEFWAYSPLLLGPRFERTGRSSRRMTIRAPVAGRPFWTTWPQNSV